MPATVRTLGNTLYEANQSILDGRTCQATITAHAGGGMASAVQITSSNADVTTVASAGDSVGLPAAVAGASLRVSNAGANSMNVFPAAGSADTIKGAQTGSAVAAGKSAEFFCVVAGEWKVIPSA